MIYKKNNKEREKENNKKSILNKIKQINNHHQISNY